MRKDTSRWGADDVIIPAVYHFIYDAVPHNIYLGTE